jgi:DnaK suppressor protein
MTRTPSASQPRYEGLLLARRQSLLRDLEGLDQERTAEGQEVSGIPLHPADLGTDSSEYDVNRSCSETAVTEIREIDDALARIHAGTFGRCESCGHAIPAARLEAIPYARLCLPCKAGEEAA